MTKSLSLILLYLILSEVCFVNDFVQYQQLLCTDNDGILQIWVNNSMPLPDVESLIVLTPPNSQQHFDLLKILSFRRRHGP